MKDNIPASYTDKDITDYLWTTLKSGRVVPGYGHAVLRKPDPRFVEMTDNLERFEDGMSQIERLVTRNKNRGDGMLGSSLTAPAPAPANVQISLRTTRTWPRRTRASATSRAGSQSR